MAFPTKAEMVLNSADEDAFGGVAVVLQTQFVTHLVGQFLWFVSHGITPTLQVMMEGSG